MFFFAVGICDKAGLHAVEKLYLRGFNFHNLQKLIFAHAIFYFIFRMIEIVKRSVFDKPNRDREI